MSPKKSSIDDVLEAVHALSVYVDKRFDTLEARFDGRINGLDTRFSGVEKRLMSVGSQMVTKDYLDGKLADLRGDLTLLTRKEDSKLLAIVDLLYGKRIMTKTERQQIMALEPFAQSA
ncbi:MAG: hypothetical protein WCV85_03495 [Patescibacteria group bacterium]|jgi:hypothetical protein